MESGPDVPEDVHGTLLSETAGTAELQHPLPDILRRDNRSDTAIDELQTVGRHNDGTCREVEDTTAPGHTRRHVETVHGEPGHDVHGFDVL